MGITSKAHTTRINRAQKYNMFGIFFGIDICLFGNDVEYMLFIYLLYIFVKIKTWYFSHFRFNESVDEL